MAFFKLKCPAEQFAALAYEITFHLITDFLPDVQIGDLVRLEQEGSDATLARQIAGCVHLPPSRTKKTLLHMLPLDHPTMRQVELANPDGETTTFWVGSRDKFDVGSTIRLLGIDTNWTVRQACTSLPVAAIPRKARIGILSEVYA